MGLPFKLKAFDWSILYCEIAYIFPQFSNTSANEKKTFIEEERFFITSFLFLPFATELKAQNDVIWRENLFISHDIDVSPSSTNDLLSRHFWSFSFPSNFFISANSTARHAEEGEHEKKVFVDWRKMMNRFRSQFWIRYVSRQ